MARQRDQHAGEQRVALEQHQRVQRVAVLAQGVLDVAVVGRVLGGGEQRAVQPDPAGFVVDLVLVPAALGNLDQDVELQHGSSPFGARAGWSIGAGAPAASRAERDAMPTIVAYRDSPAYGQPAGCAADHRGCPARRHRLRGGRLGPAVPGRSQLPSDPRSRLRPRRRRARAGRCPPPRRAHRPGQRRAGADAGRRGRGAGRRAGRHRAWVRRFRPRSSTRPPAPRCSAGVPDASVAPASTSKLFTAAAILTVHKATDRFRTPVVAGPTRARWCWSAAVTPRCPAPPAGQPTEYPEAGRISDLAAPVAHALGATPVSPGARRRLAVHRPGDRARLGAGGCAVQLCLPDHRGHGGRRPGHPGRCNCAPATPDLAAGQRTGHRARRRRSVARRRRRPERGCWAPCRRLRSAVLVEQMLRDSDNVIAEVLARQVALAAHQPGLVRGRRRPRSERARSGRHLDRHRHEGRQRAVGAGPDSGRGAEHGAGARRSAARRACGRS